MASRKKAPALTALASDWTWEQDSALRFTRFDMGGGTPAEIERARSVLGKRCWESGIEVEGGWPAHRALLEARQPYRDVLMWRTLDDGSRRYVQVSGEPVFDSRGRFRGYRGVGRNVTAHKRGEHLLRLQYDITRHLADAGALDGSVAALRALCESEGYERGELWRLDEPAGLMRRFAQWPAPPADAPTDAQPICRQDEGLVGRVWRSAEPLWLDRDDEPPGRGHLLCPIPSGGRIVGVLHFTRLRLRAPEAALQQALVGVSTQLGLFFRRAEAETRLRESEAHFRQVVDSANDGIVVYDREHIIRVANAAAAKIIGVPIEQLLGRPGIASVVPCVREDGSPIGPENRPTRVTARSGRPVSGLIMGITRPDATVTWVSVNTAFLRKPGESTHHGIVSTFSDVTTRRNIELALRNSEARFRSLTDLSSDWFWEQDAEHRFVRLEGRNVAGGDGQFQRLLLGKRRWEVGLEVEGGWEAHRRMLEAHKPYSDLLMWRTLGDGSRRYVSVSGEPLFGPEGRFIGYRGVGRDITGQKRAEDLLRLEHRVAAALSQAQEARAGIETVMRHVAEAEGWHWARYQGSDPLESAVFGQSGQDARFTIPVASEAGPLGVLAFGGGPARAPDERLVQAAGVIGSQVGQFLRRMQAEASLRRSEARFRALTAMSSDFFWETDVEHRLVGMAHGGGEPQSADLFIGPDGWAALREPMEARRPFREVELSRPQPDGTRRYYAVSGEPQWAPGGAFAGYRGVGRDVTDIALARERIASLAFRDALTGLDNRSSLQPTLEKAIERTRRRGVLLAGLFIDLDGFKAVNDAHGHDAGDRLLVEVARRLRTGLRSTDPVARLGGDEFFIVLEDLNDATPAERVAEKMLAALRLPYQLGGGIVARLSASIGISLYPDDAGDAATLMKHADTAMYQAKEAGKNAFCVFGRGPAANDAGTASAQRSEG